MQSGWLIVSQIIVTLLVGAVGWYFADQQRKLAKAKLRLDLFEHRFAILGAVRRLLSQVISHGKVSNEQFNKFGLDTLDTEFLFDDEMAAYVKELRDHLAKLMAFNAMLEGPDRVTAAEKKGRETEWFVNQIATLNTKFRPFLKL